MGLTHDGVNFLHAASVIALEKARVSFEPLIESLSVRVAHVMTKVCAVTEYMMRESKERTKNHHWKLFDDDDKDDVIGGSINGLGRSTDVSQNPQFRQLLRKIFEKFVKKCSESVRPESSPPPFDSFPVV